MNGVCSPNIFFLFGIHDLLEWSELDGWLGWINGWVSQPFFFLCWEFMICYDGRMYGWMDGWMGFSNFLFFVWNSWFVMMDGTGSQQCFWNLDFIKKKLSWWMMDDGWWMIDGWMDRFTTLFL
jgi:hypothetical protein